MTHSPPPEILYKSEPYSIPQFDGNISLTSSIYENESNCSSSPTDDQLPSATKIPTVVGFRPGKYYQSEPAYWPSWFEPMQRRPSDIRPVRQTLRRNNQQAVCNTLPVISVSNLRSLMPKINNFKNDMLEREI